MSNSNYPQYLHHGAANGVTGSCHRFIASPNVHLLIDCGLFQGQEASTNSLKQHEVLFNLTAVQALIITHVHIDHIGRLPYLLAAGYKGPIYCSIPSARLIPLVIEDALKMGFTRDAKLITRFLQTVQQQLRPLDYKYWKEIYSDDNMLLRMRLQRAGHILGSAYVELDLKTRQLSTDSWQSHRTVYSGDLGAPHAPLLPAPQSPYGTDTLIIESTYGNKLHEGRRERRLRLRAVLEHALANGGTVMIPAFSIGRTQELLYELEALIHDSHGLSNINDLEVIVDSPLASKFTEVYKELKPYWDKEALQRLRAGRHPLDFETLYTVDSHQEHEKTVEYLAKTRRPAVVIAASGMAAGGRIVNYLKAMIGDPQHCVLFVGYQAPGTPGHTIQKFGRQFGSQKAAGIEPWVELDGQRYPVRCQVETISGYSAHADQHNLVNFVRRMRRWPTQIRIVHGSDQAREALRNEYSKMAAAAGKQIKLVLPMADVADFDC
jgi:metallo-beta-lactamase family protein